MTQDPESGITSRIHDTDLKVPKREIFDLFDFNNFYVIKCLLGQMRIILSLLAYAQCTLATIFDFELSQKKLLQICLRST